MILFVDDEIMQMYLLKESLRESLPDVFIYWCQFLSHARQILSSRIYQFDLVVIDVNGVTMGDFGKEVQAIQGENIVITSNVLIPINISHQKRFVLKENIAKYISDFYKS